MIPHHRTSQFLQIFQVIPVQQLIAGLESEQGCVSTVRVVGHDGLLELSATLNQVTKLVT